MLTIQLCIEIVPSQMINLKASKYYNAFRLIIFAIVVVVADVIVVVLVKV